jgi:hypothetical protein
MSDVKRMDIKEFRELGFLQEVNRHFFHPLGLALEVITEEDGSEKLGGIWDYREDPEGIYFDGGYGMDREKALHVQGEFARHLKERNRMFEVEDGVQPLPEVEKDADPARGA